MRFTEEVEVKTNLSMVARDRGKIVDRRDTHNIFLDVGREWLTQLISYKGYSPDEYLREDRVRYMGFGIGGSRQLALPTANSSPLGGPGDPYEANSALGIGSNIQTDLDRTVAYLERPVRIRGGSSRYPGGSSDIWVGQIQAPPEHPTGTSVRFKRLFSADELSYTPFTTVPLSEIMLFTSRANPNFYLNAGIAYDTFDTLSKNSAISLEVSWTFNF